MSARPSSPIFSVGHRRRDHVASMIPYRDENPTRRFAWVTLGLILVNVFVFLLVEPATSDQANQQSYFLCHAEIPYEVTHQTSLARGGAGALAAIANDYSLPAEQAAQVQ